MSAVINREVQTAATAPTHATVSALPGAIMPSATPSNVAATPRTPLRRIFRQKPWFMCATGLIGLGAFMLMQPFSLDLFSYSFVVLLAGVVGFEVAGRLPK
jgi:hypothetical protein